MGTLIKTITPEQQKYFSELMLRYRDNIAGITDVELCKNAAIALYRNMGIKKPPAILHFTSPFLSVIASTLFKKLRGQLYGQLHGQLHGQLYGQLYGQLHGQLREQLYGQLHGQLHGQLYEQLYEQLRGQLHGQLREQLYGQLREQLYEQLRGQLYGQLYGQLHEQLHEQLYEHYQVFWWNTWMCYYEFGNHIGVLFDKPKYDLFYDFVSNIHTCLPYKNIFIYSFKPTRCYWKGNRLHNDKGMAVEYADGWGFYSLNGIRMKPEYVLTPAAELKPETVLKEKSVDVRRELLRKVGVIQMVSHGKVVEESGYYKLVDMSPVFTGIRYAPHLLMKNPSVDDTWHLEGVHPQCETIQQAINWRAGNINALWTPAQLS